MGSEVKSKDRKSSTLLTLSPTFLLVFALLGSNIFTYLFCSALLISREHARQIIYKQEKEAMLDLMGTLLKQINNTELHLQKTQRDLVDVRAELRASRMDFSKVFLGSISKNMEMINASTRAMSNMVDLLSGKSNGQDQDYWDPWFRWSSWMKENGNDDGDSMSKELVEASAVRPLPLGFHPGQGSGTMVSSIGHACPLEEEELKAFMDYKVRGPCPDDQHLAQSLVLHGCEPLPRRRCYAATPDNFTEPYAIPESYWKLPPDGNILWTPYTCKSFQCLNERKKNRVMDDCNDCFDLQSNEQYRWQMHGGELDFSIEEAIGHKMSTIRIGLDIGGGSASFAVRMAERNITIVTTSMNLNGPFNNFIALRGVVPLYITIAQRLPFFDNTLDIVHSMHVLSHWIPVETFEFLLFDIDRVLRPGGIFWLDRFFCKKTQLESVYMPMIDGLKYNTHKWVTGRKFDREREEISYLSAVLEKPLSRAL